MNASQPTKGSKWSLKRVFSSQSKLGLSAYECSSRAFHPTVLSWANTWLESSFQTHTPKFLHSFKSSKSLNPSATAYYFVKLVWRLWTWWGEKKNDHLKSHSQNITVQHDTYDTPSSILRSDSANCKAGLPLATGPARLGIHKNGSWRGLMQKMQSIAQPFWHQTNTQANMINIAKQT